MKEFIKKFSNHNEYTAFTQTADFIKPNVSLCVNENEVHYNPIETRLVATFNVTSTSNATPIMGSNAASQFGEIEIDGVVQPSVVSSYTFNATGEHIVKYTLVDNTDIGDAAFRNCSNLTSVTIPNSVTYIGTGMFASCSSLTFVTIPNSIIFIGNDAFYSCSSLTSVTIPNSVTSIEGSAFRNCSGLTEITIPDSVASIGEETFRGCNNLTSIICNAMKAPVIQNNTFRNMKTGGTLIVPIGSTGYNVWMSTGHYYLGSYDWTKVEQ